jgi:cytochrome P450
LLIRTAVVDTELGGVPVKARDGINVSIASANRDPARFEDPTLFNPPR